MAIFLVPAVFVIGAEPPPDSMTGMAAAYREGRSADALDGAANVLETDPANREARQYLWTLGRQLQERETSGVLKKGERERDVALAEESLARRRKETEEVLGRLKASYEKSRRVKSPSDVLAAAEGMGRFLGDRFNEERQQALADGYFRGLVENLSRAVKGKTFVTRKDQFVAEAWLAYYGGDRQKAVTKWESAAREDPGDRDVAQNLDQLRRMLRREEDEKAIRNWESQAAAFEQTGHPKEALDLYEKILKKDPARADVKREAEECRLAVAGKAKADRLSAMTEEGVRLYKEGKVLDAAEAWFKVLEEDPSQREARIWLAHAGRQLGTTEAPAAPASAARSAPKPGSSSEDDKRAALELHKQGLVAYSQDRVALAVELWEKALVRDPDLTQAREALRQAKAELTYKQTAR